MKVLFSFPHAVGAPGIGWTVWNQVTEVARRGHEVHVVAASVARPLPGVRVTETLALRGVRVPHRAVGRDRAFEWHDRIAARVYARTRPDVVHLWPLAPGHTARAARDGGAAVLREAPNTQTEHAWRVVDEEVRSLGLQGSFTTAHTFDAAHLRMERAEWDAATAVLAPSEAVAETFRSAGHAPHRVLRHQYGYRPGHRRVRARTEDPAPLRAVFVGRGEPRKGLHYALRAWIDSEASARGTFTIVGRIVPAYEAALAADLAHPSVRAVGFSRDVESALAASDVLLLPTVEEGSALVTYEAQAVGCVPLVSRAAGALMDDGVQGLLHEPRDVAALTAQLDLLAGDRSRLAELSLASLAHRDALTWEAAGERLENAYVDALALADAPPRSLVTGGEPGALAL